MTTDDRSGLAGSPRPLAEIYDLAMLDLDGVVYIGPHAVPGAAEAVARWRDGGGRTAFITNNAARPPEVVAEHLVELGVGAEVSDVVTSAQAVAGLLRERFGEDAVVGVLGGPGLEAAVRAAGLEVVEPGAEAHVAVVTGYGPDVAWSQVMRAAVAVRDGTPWFASNTDMTIPTPYGTAPGHGVQVDMIARFAGVHPIVAGKPEPPLLQETLRRMTPSRPLMVGDRIDTDIRGGRLVEVDTLLVMTGVTDLGVLAVTGPADRPTHLAVDLGGLLTEHPAVAAAPEVRCAGWTARVEDGRLAVTGDGEASDWWRAAAVALWHHLDTTGEAAEVAGCEPPSGR